AGGQAFYAEFVHGALCAGIARARQLRRPRSLPRNHASSPMLFLTRIGIALAWLAGIVLTLIGVCTTDPVLTALRASTSVAIAVASLGGAVLLCWGGWRRGWARRCLILLWCLPSLSMAGTEMSFVARKHAVLATEPALARTLGQHFVVGYTSFDEVARLAEK